MHAESCSFVGSHLAVEMDRQVLCPICIDRAPRYDLEETVPSDTVSDVSLKQNVLTEMGVHHDTALTACAIIAGNRFDGFLSTTADGIDATIPFLDRVYPQQTGLA